jgi:hypothetical protein
MSLLQDFLLRRRLGWPERGRLATHPRGTFAFEQGTEVPGRLREAFGDLSRLAAIDLGCGPVETPVAQAVFAVPWRRLVSVELFPPYLEKLRGKQAAAAGHEILECEIGKAVDRLKPGEIDVALMIDVLEHQTREAALRLLERLEQRVRGIVLFSPVGPAPQDAIDGNELQRHRSTWHPEDWLRLGYDVEHYEALHGHLDPPVDAAWAIKRIEPQT